MATVKQMVHFQAVQSPWHLLCQLVILSFLLLCLLIHQPATPISAVGKWPLTSPLVHALSDIDKTHGRGEEIDGLRTPVMGN